MKYLLTALSVAFAMLVGSYAQAHDPPPNFGQWVVDNAKVLSKQDYLSISGKLLAIQRNTGGRGVGAQVAVLTVKSLDGDDIKDFAYRTSRAWKLGVKGAGSQGKSNGVLILIVKDTAQVRIEVGTGLEGVLNDAKVDRIRRDHFATGVSKTAGDALKGTIDEIAKEIYREYNVQSPATTPEPPQKTVSEEAGKANGDKWLILFGVTILISGILGAIFHRRRRRLRYWFGGALGGSSWYAVAAFYTLSGLTLWAVVALGYVLGYMLAALFRHGGDRWLFDPFPRPIGVGSGTGSEGLRGGGGDFAGGGADGSVDPGLFDGVGDALSNIQPPSDCPDLGGCDAGGCDVGGCG